MHPLPSPLSARRMRGTILGSGIGARSQNPAVPDNIRPGGSGLRPCRHCTRKSTSYWRMRWWGYDPSLGDHSWNS
eukprot:12907909-Prorocentrum_lima.AAC.1